MSVLLPNATFVKLCRARDFLRDCYAEPVVLADAAAEADLSPWHFLRLFRATFGETPHEYLTRLRIDKAKELLIVADRSVTDICLDVGFSSLGSFSTLFARHVGASPVAYRRQLRSLVVHPGYHPWACVPCCFARQFAGQFGLDRKIREASSGETFVYWAPAVG
jgi:AraC-like DNA-binding protein